MKNLLNFLNLLIFLLSPLAIIAFLVGFVILLDTISQHQTLVQKLEKRGEIIEAQVSSYAEENGWVFVEYRDHRENERYGILNVRYYSDITIAEISNAEVITIRYLPELYETDVVLEAEFDRVRHYHGHLKDVSIVLLFSWIIIIIHPEWLYIGHTNAFEKALESITSS